MANPLQAIRDLFPGVGVEGAVSTHPDPGTQHTDPDPNATPDPNASPAPGLPTATPDPGSQSQEPKDPLAHFAQIFDNKQLEANQPDPTVGSADLFTNENMGKILESLPNFTDHISQETREKLAAGEDPNAVMLAFDEIGKGAYSAALQHAVRLSESLTGKRLEAMEASFSDKINQHQVQQNINQHELIKGSPVLQAGISIIADRLQRTNPTASPQWITEQSTKFFMESANVLSGNEPGGKKIPGAGDNPPASDETNWVEFAQTTGAAPPDSSGEAQ